MKVDWEIDKSWTLFLDRDGVINERIMGGYVIDKSQFQFKEKAVESLSQLTKKFAHVFIVTNQQGVGLGRMSEQQLNEIHEFMISEISDSGGSISKVYAAIELKNEWSEMRKPKPKMALMAQEEFPDISFDKSIMVGDTDSDIRFGKNLGMKTVLILTEEKTSEKPDIIVSSLHELNNLISKKA
jgi:D-glycero-D-manno-heptose 1,7-bisphosphate phosphatase